MFAGRPPVAPSSIAGRLAPRGDFSTASYTPQESFGQTGRRNGFTMIGLARKGEERLVCDDAQGGYGDFGMIRAA